jgi:hypothetical protein
MAILDGSDDVFDSREVIERIEALEAVAVIDREPDEQDELDALYAFQEEVGDDTEWSDGMTFISEDYFESYAKELAEDIGAVDPNASWPLGYIDWERAADALLVDYSDVSFFGTTYHYRV